MLSDDRIAQVSTYPADTLDHTVPDDTATGSQRCVSVPSPSCPYVLAPQQYNAPAEVNPHECWYPLDTEAHDSGPGSRSGGDVDADISSVPAAPLRPLPQMYNGPEAMEIDPDGVDAGPVPTAFAAVTVNV